MALIDPNLSLHYGWAFRESGWKAGMDANLKRLGALVHLSVLAVTDAPPHSPVNGDRYIIGTGTGAWAGRNNQVAVRVAGAWVYYIPQEGWSAWDSGEQHDLKFVQGSWVIALEGKEGDPGPVGPSSLSLLIFNSRLYPENGSQAPEFFMPRAGAFSYVEASGAARSADVVVQVFKNGFPTFTTSALPSVPAAGGVGIRRVPDLVDFAQGDKITIKLMDTDGSKHKVLVYLAFN